MGLQDTLAKAKAFDEQEKIRIAQEAEIAGRLSAEERNAIKMNEFARRNAEKQLIMENKAKQEAKRAFSAGRNQNPEAAYAERIADAEIASKTPLVDTQGLSEANGVDIGRKLVQEPVIETQVPIYQNTYNVGQTRPNISESGAMGFTPEMLDQIANSQAQNVETTNNTSIQTNGEKMAMDQLFKQSQSPVTKSSQQLLDEVINGKQTQGQQVQR